MSRNLLKTAASLAFVLSLMGCQKTLQPWFVSTYQMKPPIRLDVVTVDVRNLYTPQSESPNVEMQFDERPDQVVSQWATAYLQAGGESGRAIVFIDEASVVEEDAGKNTRYTMSLRIRVEVLDLRGALIGEVKLSGNRTHAIPKSHTALQRNQAWQIMIEELLGAFEPELRLQITNKMPKALIEG